MNELEKLAESVKKQLNLKYDADSVKFVEGFIERNKGNFEKEESKGLINSLGSFLGQCIIENYGGQWQPDNETGSVAVVFDDKNRAYPLPRSASNLKMV